MRETETTFRAVEMVISCLDCHHHGLDQLFVQGVTWITLIASCPKAISKLFAVSIQMGDQGIGGFTIGIWLPSGNGRSCRFPQLIATRVEDWKRCVAEVLRDARGVSLAGRRVEARNVLETELDKQRIESSKGRVWGI
jgi:hypothetical protein